jgi:hypothetical protein
MRVCQFRHYGTLENISAIDTAESLNRLDKCYKHWLRCQFIPFLLTYTQGLACSTLKTLLHGFALEVGQHADKSLKAMDP